MIINLAPRSCTKNLEQKAYLKSKMYLYVMNLFRWAMVRKAGSELGKAISEITLSGLPLNGWGSFSLSRWFVLQKIICKQDSWYSVSMHANEISVEQ